MEKNKKIAIIDAGNGNVESIKNILNVIGFDSDLVSDSKNLHFYKLIILPGVGAFDPVITNLERTGFFDYIKNIHKDQFLLGICVGMQILVSNSEEGVKKGLNLIPGITKKFPKEINFKLPHLGWNIVNCNKNNLFDLSKKFYFTHSYYVETSSEFIIADTNYNIKFPSFITNNVNIFGVQFHPEKSHIHGKNFFKNFFNYIQV
jgi:glutamine amidotransferase